MEYQQIGGERSYSSNRYGSSSRSSSSSSSSSSLPQLHWRKPSPLPTERTAKVVEPVRRAPNVADAGVIAKAEDLISGQVVQHARFGVGSIKVCEGEKITIAFETGEKQLLVKACLEHGLLQRVNHTE